MSYRKRQRRKQYNRGVERVDRLLEERSEKVVPPNPVEDLDPEVIEAIKNIDRRKRELDDRST